jgi:hypothetical protein
VVTEFAAGVTSGFSAGSDPFAIAADPLGPIWFTEIANGGGVARLTAGVSEFPGGTTPGFSAASGPIGIAAGPDGNMWFTEETDPGRVARITPTGVVTEFTGGVTPDFSANGHPHAITAGPDGAMWFTERLGAGRVVRITVGPAVTTGEASGIGPTSATLDGSVRPNGQTTVERFEYGTSAGYGSQTTDASAGSGLVAHEVSSQLTGLTPNTLYHYRLTATNDSDTTIGFDRTFTTPAPTAKPPDGGGDAPLVTIRRLRLSRSAFRAAGRGPSARSAPRGRRPTTGTIVSFRLDRAATVRFTVERASRGRRVGRSCVAPGQSERGGARCTIYSKLRGSFARSGRAGPNRFRFTGRLHGRLRPARYRLLATPRADTRSGKSASARFRIVR